jgi:signal transduction histidine kinase
MYPMSSEKNLLSPDVMRKNPFFGSFSHTQLTMILDTAPHISVKANTIIFSQGERFTGLHLILKGVIRFEHESEGEKFLVVELNENQSFGEEALFSGELCQATVTAVEDSEFLILDRELMLEIIRRSSPEEIIDIFSGLSKQVHTSKSREFEHVLERLTLADKMEAEKQRALTEMVAGVSHEINTPLSVINTAVSVMARELASPKEVTLQRAADIAESLELIQRNVERAHRLVQDFKKVSVSQLVDQKELFDISEAVEETVHLVLVSLKRSQIGVNFVNRLAFEQKSWIGYRGALSQILINLLMNAERHAYPNGIGGVVDVTIELADDKNYRLVVQDYGNGIPRGNQARIFEPFFTTGRSMGGTGLGLAIVHNLVTNVLKGQISVRTDVLKGTAFSVIFPRVLPE